MQISPFATYSSAEHLVNNGQRLSMSDEWLVGSGWSFKSDGYLERLDQYQYVYDMATKYELKYINTSDRNQGLYVESYDEFWNIIRPLNLAVNMPPYGGSETPPFQGVPININEFRIYPSGVPLADKVLFEIAGLYRVRGSMKGTEGNSVVLMFNNEFIESNIYLIKGGGKVDHNGDTAFSTNIYNPNTVKYESNRVQGRDNATHLPANHEIVTSNKWLITNRDGTAVTKDKNGTALSTNASFVTGKNILEFNPTALPDGKYSAKVSETSTTRFGNPLGTKEEITQFIIITPLSRIDNISTSTTPPTIGNETSWQALQEIDPTNVTIGGKYGGQGDPEMTSKVSYEIYKKDGTPVGSGNLGTNKDHLTFEDELASLGYGDYYIKVTDTIPETGETHSTYAKFNIEGSYVKTEHYLNHPTNGPTPIGTWPPTVEGALGNPENTVGFNTSNTKYELVEIVEVVPGLPENIMSNPSANDFSTNFPDNQGETTVVKYYYREIVGITINKTLTAGSIGNDSFQFSIWQSDKNESDATTHSITLNSGDISGSSTIDGLIAGQDYYIKEVISSPASSSYKFDSITGATLDQAKGAYKFTAPVDGSQALTVIATNLYNTVDINLNKVITNNSGQLINASDSFNIVISNTTLGYNESYTVVPGSQTAVTGLVVGQTYTITEVLPANSSYELVGMSANNGVILTSIGNGKYTFTAPASNITGVEITASNAALLNKISIKKVMASLVNPIESDHAFDFYIWPVGDTKPSEPNVKNVTVNGTAVISPDFIVGKEYIIEEASRTGYIFEGFTNATDNGSGQYTFVVPPQGTTLEITATNNLDIVPSGLVKLSKKLDSGNPYNPNDTFEITVSRVNSTGNLVDGTIYNVKVSEVVSVSNLIAGQTYRISETNLDSGYSFESIDDGTTTLATNSFDFVAPASNSLNNILFSITNSLDKGQVVIEKGYGSSNPLNNQETFNFKIWKQSDNISTATSNSLIVNGSSGNITIDNLQGGVGYYIAEDSVAGYRLTEVKNGASVIAPVAVGGVNAYPFTAPTSTSGSITLHFDNERDELLPGAITIEKMLTSPQTALSASDLFTVEIQRLNPDNSVSSDAPITHTLNIGSTQTSILGLVAGQKYQITEVSIPTGYQFVSLTDSQGNLSLTETSSGIFTFTAPASNTPVGHINLKVENKHKLIPAGSLQLIKSLGGSRPLNDAHVFDFFLWRDGETKPATPNITGVNLTTPTNLPALIAGQKYYLEENEFTGYVFLGFTASDITLNSESNGIYSFNAPNTTPATPILVYANNVRDSINAVTLKKVAASTINNPENFTFLVWRNGDLRLNGVEYTVAANANATSIDGLVPGQEYFIEEYASSGYKLSSINGATKVSDYVYSFTVPTSTATPLELVATNEFSLVDITITKQLDKPAIGNDTFDFIIWRADQTEVDAIPKSVTLASGASTGSEIVTGLISGQDYYIKEVIVNPPSNKYKFVDITGANFVSSKNAYKFTAPAEGSTPTDLTITANNTYNVIDLTITKTIANNGGQLIDSGDTFVVTISNAALGYNESYTISPTSSANVTGLVVGETYTITETIPSGKGYELSGMLGNGGLALTDSGGGTYTFVVPGSDQNSIAIQVSNSVQFSKAEIKKTLGGATLLEADHTFDFYLWAKDGETKPSNPNITGVVPDGSSVLSQDLVVGKTYIIEEAVKSGYTLSGLTGATLTGSQYTFVAPASGTTIEIVATNELSIVPPTKLELTKEISNGSPHNATDNFTVTIGRVKLDGSIVDEVDYIISADQVVNITGVVAGQKYKIVESDMSLGYIFESIDDDTNWEFGPNFEFIAPASDTSATIKFTVTNRLDLGEVVIEKDFGTSSPLNINENFTFRVWKVGQQLSSAISKTLTTNGSFGSVTFDNLQSGVEYYIAENDASGYSLTGVKDGSGATITAETIEGVSAYKFTAPTSGAGGLKLKFTNERSLVAIDIEKIITGGGSAFNPSDAFSVTLQRIDSSGNPTIDPSITVSLTVGTVSTINNLVAGQLYEIVELTPPIGYVFEGITDFSGTLTLTETPAGSGKFRFTAPTASGNIKLQVENDYDIIPAGSLKIIKDMGTSQLLTGTDTFDFFLWKNGETKPALANITGVGTVNQVNFPQLVAGQKYYIEESAFLGYTFLSFTSSDINLVAEGNGVYSFIAPTSTPATPLVVTSNNARDSINAVTLKKVAATTINNPESFEFIIWRNGDIKLTDGVTYSVNANGSPVNIDNLVPGQEYFIEETAKSGYKLDNIVNATLEIGNVYKFTVPTSSANPLELIANNDLSLVDITLVKSIAAGALANDTFSFNIWRADQTEASATSYSVSLTAGSTSNSAVISGLIADQDYYVKEIIANPDTNSYKFGSITGATFDSGIGAYKFTAPAEGSVPTALTITATNLYNSGGLLLKKVIDNNSGNLVNSADTFTIKVVNTILGYDEEYTVSPSASVTIDDLVVGQTYTISEIIPAGKSYILDRMSGSGITLTPAGVGEYTFVAPSSTATGIEITAYNLVDFTTVEIVKFVDPITSLLESNHTFSFYLWADGETKPATPNIIGVNPDGTPKNSQQLIVGNKYFIEEDAITGYKIKSVAGATLENGKYAFIAPASGTPLQIVFTNELDLIPNGKVKLTKSITNGSPYQATDSFEITVGRVAANGTLVDSNIYTINADETVNITDLVAGQTYRVTETNLDSGYLFVNIDNGTTTVTTNSFEFVAPASNATSTILVTVKNKLDKGQVIIEKNFGTSSPLNSSETFNFKIWKTSDNISTAVTKVLNVNGSTGQLIIDDLQGGVNYYIAENSSAGYILSGVKLGNTPLTATTIGGVSAYQFTAPLGTSGSVTLFFTNVRDEVLAGALTLEKILFGTQTVLDPAHRFNVSIQRLNSAGTPSTDPAMQYSLAVNAPTNITGLVAGQSYEISETNIPTGYTFVGLADSEGNLTLTETPVGSGKYRFIAPPANTALGHIKLEVENKHNILTGAVQILKNVPAPGLVNSTDTFSFYVWHHAEPSRPVTPNVVNVGTTAKVNLPPLIAGQKYYIEEDINNKYSFIDFRATGITLTSESNGVYSFYAPAIMPASPILITANNNRASINAVSIFKDVTDPITNALDPLSNNKEFDFVVWHSGENESNGKTIKVKANNSIPVEINGLVPGETYYIKEILKAGYELSDIANATLVTPGKYSFVAPTTVANPIVLRANNNLKLVDGRAEIIKVTADGTLINPTDNTFEFVIWRKDTARPSAVTHTATANSNTATILNQLVEGETYYIDEVKKTGYALESMQINGTSLQRDSANNMLYFPVPISAASKITITVTNNFDYASLSLLKKFEQGQSLLNSTDTFTVDVWDTAKPSSTAKTYTITPNGSAVKVEGIIAGNTYSLKEASKTGYKLKNMTIGGTTLTEAPVGSGIYQYTAPAVVGTNVVIEVNNALDYLLDGTVRLTKSIASGQSPLDASQMFEFKIWSAKATKPATSNYSVAIGGTVHLKDLVVGEKYYIEESSTKGYKLDLMRIGTNELSKDSTGYFFIAPTDNNNIVNVEAVNKLDTVSISIKKVMKDGQLPMKVDDVFTITLKRDGSNVVTNHQLTVNGSSISVDNLIAGYKYYITELNETFYRFNKFTSELAIASDANGHYFTAPASTGKAYEITVVNELDTLPPKSVGLAKEMYLNDDNVQVKPVSPSDQFRFFIWRDGTPKPSSPNYKTRVNNKDFVDISEEIIAGAKYYVEEEGKVGYIFKEFILGGKPLSRDSIGYYFVIDSKDIGNKLTLKAVNDLDILEKGTVLLEKVMVDGEKPLNNQDNFDIYIKPVKKNTDGNGDRYRVKVNGDRVELGAMVAGAEYYVIEEPHEGYKLNKIYLNGNEMDRNEETGYFFFTAPLDGGPSVVTVENRLGVGTVSVNKYIDKKLGGTTKIDEELFKVIIRSTDSSYKIEGHISSLNGEFTADSDDFTNLPVGKYLVIEVIDEETNFVYSKTKIDVDGYITDGESFEITPTTDSVTIDIYNNIKSRFSFSSIPDAGGVPLSVVIIPGILLIGLGLFFSAKKKKNDH